MYNSFVFYKFIDVQLNNQKRKLSLDIRESLVDLMFTILLFVYLESNKFVFAFLWLISKRDKDKSVKTKVAEYR